MNVCICVCMYVCMYVCRYVYMFVRMLEYTYVCMNVCMYVRMYVCTYVRVLCMYVYTYVCMYVCMHAFMSILYKLNSQKSVTTGKDDKNGLYLLNVFNVSAIIKDKEMNTKCFLVEHTQVGVSSECTIKQ